MRAKRSVYLLCMLGAIVVLLCKGGHAQSPETLSLQERAMTASRIYRIVSTFFPGLSQAQFDSAYAEYLGRVLKVEDRREFDLLSMEFIADLHDGHSWFYDKWIDKIYGQPTGFVAYPLAGEWTVIRSRLDFLRVGDVIKELDGVPIDRYFDSNRKYVSASSDRDAGLSFFDTPPIFPERFELTLAGGRKVLLDRKNDKKKDEPEGRTEGRWMAKGSVAYVRVPTFHGIETQAQALAYFREFHEAKTIILDVRGNPGTGQPLALQRSLMSKPYHYWTESTSMHGGAMLRNYAPTYPEHSETTMSDAVVEPRDVAYSGRLILLIDRGCSCACEDFVMPFKVEKRAQLVGETTAGSFSFTHFTAFDNGMLLNIAAARHTFPDGSRFEGVGIAPDVEVRVTAEDLQAGRDVVLSKAIDLANEQ